MSAHPTIRVWNDRNAYKKLFLIYGLEHLQRQGSISVVHKDYHYFVERGAPHYRDDTVSSLKNIVVFEYEYHGKCLNAVYDANDIYYKNPADLLAWCDLYFKSNFQEDYLRTGKFLENEFWSKLPFFGDLASTPLDVRQFHKFRRANFTMEVYPASWRNRWHFRLNEGRWLKTTIDKKASDLFFVGRYWQETKNASLNLVARAAEDGRRFSGGLVEATEPIPAEFVKFRHKAIGLGRWCALASQSRAVVITRGLQGCVGFKPLNLLMIGAPFFANRLHSNLVHPLSEGVNYIPVADDFSDLGEKFKSTTDRELTEMGRRNFDVWQHTVSPTATAKYVCNELEKLT